MPLGLEPHVSASVVRSQTCARIHGTRVRVWGSSFSHVLPPPLYLPKSAKHVTAARCWISDQKYTLLWDLTVWIRMCVTELAWSVWRCAKPTDAALHASFMTLCLLSSGRTGVKGKSETESMEVVLYLVIFVDACANHVFICGRICCWHHVVDVIAKPHQSSPQEMTMLVAVLRGTWPRHGCTLPGRHIACHQLEYGRVLSVKWFDGSSRMNSSC